MTEKQKYALDKIISALPEDLRESCREIAGYAISLGYMPVLKGVRENYADFVNRKLKRTILKIQTNPGFPFLEMKFYALRSYAGIFQDAIENRLVYWDKLGYEASCFGCGKCDGTHGYVCALPDGGQGFLCGFGVVPLPGFNADNIQEVKQALKIQDEFFAG